jgi:hypothetical protein
MTEALRSAEDVAARLGARLVVALDRRAVCPVCGSADVLAGDAVMRVIDTLFAADAIAPRLRPSLN